MSLDMHGFIDPFIESTPSGPVILESPEQGDYSGPGGTWVVTTPAQNIELRLVTIQSASMKTVRTLIGEGGAVHPTDFKVLYINDGTMIYPDDTGQFAQILRFSDGRAEREWKVRESDPRPWRNYCKVIVERYRGAG